LNDSPGSDRLASGVREQTQRLHTYRKSTRTTKIMNTDQRHR